MQRARYLLQPQRPLKPPVPEELGIEGRAEDLRYRLRESTLERLLHQVDEVLRVPPYPHLRVLWRVQLLVLHGDLLPRHPPVPMPSRPPLLVEVEIVRLTRVASLARPNLEPGSRVAGEDRHCGSLVVGAFDKVWPVEQASVLLL